MMPYYFKSKDGYIIPGLLLLLLFVLIGTYVYFADRNNVTYDDTGTVGLEKNISQQDILAFIHSGNIHYGSIDRLDTVKQISDDGACFTGFLHSGNEWYPQFNYPCYYLFSWSPDGSKFLYKKKQEAGEDPVLALYDVKSNSSTEFDHPISHYSEPVWSDITPTFVYRSDDSIVQANYESKTETVLLNYEEKKGCGGASAGYLPLYDLELNTAGMRGGDTLIWDEANNYLTINTFCTFSVLKTFDYSTNKIKYEFNPSYGHAVVSSSGKIATFKEDGTLGIFNINGELLNEYVSPKRGVDLVWSTDGSILYFVNDGILMQFDLNSAAFSDLFQIEDAYIAHLSVSNQKILFTLIDASIEYGSDLDNLFSIYSYDIQTKIAEPVLNNSSQPTVFHSNN